MTKITDSPLFSYSYERLDVNDFNITLEFSSKLACSIYVQKVYEILDVDNDARYKRCSYNVTYNHVENISRLTSLARLVSDYVWCLEK